MIDENRKIDIGKEVQSAPLEEQVAATIGEYEKQFAAPRQAAKRRQITNTRWIVLLLLVVSGGAILGWKVHFNGLFGQSTLNSITGPDGHVDPNKVLHLPIQEQAQTLLVAALGHDEQAIQLLSDSSPGWRDNLHWTDNLNGLFTRAMNSRDLRLRRAATRVMLSADNAGTDADNVAHLIAQVHSGSSDGATAVMDLGAIAGVGVEQDYITAEVVKAVQSPDVTIKKNAVLALGMIGTDNSLRNLVTIYEQENDLGVREQAICSVAESGSFTRPQRMSVVPVLMASCQADSCSSAVLGWKYQALRDITDAQVASNDSAWQQWYSQNGSTTLARFRADDWWRIHGDE